MEDLTPREQQVLDLLRSGDGRCSLDDMMRAMSLDQPVRRQAIIVAIKSMNSKLALNGQLVVLDSGGRGRGNKAVYKLTTLKRKRQLA